MTFEQLKIFCTIAEEKGLIHASKKLNKAQPSVSSSLSRLEDQLGLSLFSRDGYRVVLTKEGQALYSHAVQILNQQGQFNHLAHHLKQGNEPKIRISIEVLCSMKYLKRSLKIVKAKSPLTQVDFCSDVMGGGIEKLLAGEVDICLGPQINYYENIESIFIGEEEVGPVISPSYFNAYKKSDLAKNAIQIVIHESTKEESNRSFGVLNTSKLWFTDNFVRKKELILAGNGWGIMPFHLVKEELNNKKLMVIKTFPIETKKIKMFAFRRKDLPLGPVSMNIWATLSE